VKPSNLMKLALVEFVVRISTPFDHIPKRNIRMSCRASYCLSNRQEHRRIVQKFSCQGKLFQGLPLNSGSGFSSGSTCPPEGNHNPASLCVTGPSPFDSFSQPCLKAYTAQLDQPVMSLKRRAIRRLKSGAPSTSFGKIVGNFRNHRSAPEPLF